MNSNKDLKKRKEVRAKPPYIAYTHSHDPKETYRQHVANMMDNHQPISAIQFLIKGKCPGTIDKNEFEEGFIRPTRTRIAGERKLRILPDSASEFWKNMLKVLSQGVKYIFAFKLFWICKSSWR
jgi:hypothetical protein